MANIPGISGYTQPGVFARDLIRTTATSATGTARVLIIMGEGQESSEIVQNAVGGGQDGSSTVAPDGNPKGRFFLVPNAPLVSGRTEIIHKSNSGVETVLYGAQQSLTSGVLDSKFDFRIDIEKGHLELQSPSLKDQDGKMYSTNNTGSNISPIIGNGVLASGTFGEINLLDLRDDTLENGTKIKIKCTTGFSQGGARKFQLTVNPPGGGISQTVNGINLTYLEASDGAVSGNSTSEDGFEVEKSSGYTSVVATPQGVTSIENSNVISISSTDILNNGLALVGDYLEVDGFSTQRITKIEAGTSSDTLITVEEKIYNSSSAVSTWAIKATDLFIADHENYTTDGDGDGIPDGYQQSGPFNSSYVGSVLAILSGDATGLYKIKSVTSSRTVRVCQLDDSSKAFPSAESTNGFSETDLNYRILEEAGPLLFGVKEGTTPFELGDSFILEVKSRVLSAGDSITAKYISESRLTIVEDFSSMEDIVSKFGEPSLENTISLGAQLAAANGAPLMRVLHCKPPTPRKTSITLVEERDSNGKGGLTVCGGNADDCQLDDLQFIIPAPIAGGIRSGRPSQSHGLNLFLIRNGDEVPVFLNKFSFYSSQLETESKQQEFITGSDFEDSYTIVNTDVEILGSGVSAEIFADSSPGTKAFFSVSDDKEFDFDSNNVTSETTIVVTSVEVVGSSSNTLLTSESDIAEAIFGSGNSAAGVELTVKSLVGDYIAEVSSKKLDGSSHYSINPNLDLVNVNFYIRDEEDTSNKSAALLINNSVIRSELFKSGDGLRISFVDANDSEFSDQGWNTGLEKLESVEGQIIVPLPTSAKSLIFRNVLRHCEVMSSVANKKERMAFFGAIRGVDNEALVGSKNVAVEDIGVIEGIQGDDPEEILSGFVEDLVNYKLDQNFTSNRACYFYPDEIVVNNLLVDGYYLGAAAAGWFTSNGNIAEPLTNKTLAGFSILQNKIHSNSIKNKLGEVGATVIDQGNRVLASRTTSISGFIEDEEPSIIFIRDEIKAVLRKMMKGYVGRVFDGNTLVSARVRVDTLMNGLIAKGLITSFRGLRIEQDKVDPRQLNVYVGYTPAYPINYVYIEIEVGSE